MNPKQHIVDQVVARVVASLQEIRVADGYNYEPALVRRRIILRSWDFDSSHAAPGTPAVLYFVCPQSWTDAPHNTTMMGAVTVTIELLLANQWDFGEPGDRDEPPADADEVAVVTNMARDVAKKLSGTGDAQRADDATDASVWNVVIGEWELNALAEQRAGWIVARGVLEVKYRYPKGRP